LTEDLALAGGIAATNPSRLNPELDVAALGGQMLRASDVAVSCLLHVDVIRQGLKDGPEYDSSTTVDQACEERFES